jgi:hypothetical protein
MTSTAEFDQAVRNFLANVLPGERIETLAPATSDGAGSGVSGFPS